MDKKKKIAIVVLLLAIICILLSFLLTKEEYTVSMDTTGGIEIANKVVKEGTTIGELEVPTKDGYKFLYWTLDGKKCNDNDKITKDVHLIAVWAADGNTEITKYKVTFNIDGGSVVESVEVEDGSVLVKPEEPTKEGYTFVEWQVDGVVFDFTTKITKDIELKAIWKEENEVTVSFDSNGGSKVTSQVLKEDEVAKKPPNPTKNGYKFVEWQLDGRTYDFSSKVTKDIKLVSKWEKVITYTVTFDSNGGSKVNAQTIEKDKTATKPTNPTKSGYKFVEWQLDGSSYNFGRKVTKDIILNAVWNKELDTPTLRSHKDGFVESNLYEFSLFPYGEYTKEVENDTIYKIDGWELYVNRELEGKETVEINGNIYSLFDNYPFLELAGIKYNLETNESYNYIARVYYYDGSKKVYSDWSNIKTIDAEYFSDEF